jgi:hypothetical protein
MGMNSIGRERAIELFESHWWELCDHREIAEFQLFTEYLCCPFDVFQEAVEKSLGRKVRLHEFGSAASLAAEFLGDRAPPTMVEIMDLIPAEKRIIVVVGDNPDA